MVNLLLALISVVILVPIIYLLPLGLSTKGKGLTIVFSFLLAILGLLSRLTFSLWLTSLVLLLLVFLSSLLIDSRLKKVIYAPLSKGIDNYLEDKDFRDGDENDDYNNELIASSATLVSNSKPLNLDKLIDSTSQNQSYENAREALKNELHWGLVIGSPDQNIAFQNPSLLIEDYSLDEIKLSENIEEVEEDISFLLNREELIEERPTVLKHHIPKNVGNFGYMSEIEGMIAAIDSIEQTEDRVSSMAGDFDQLDYQFDDVAATIETNENSKITQLNTDEIAELKLEKLDHVVETNDSGDLLGYVTWDDDEIEPIKIFKK